MAAIEELTRSFFHWWIGAKSDFDPSLSLSQDVVLDNGPLSVDDRAGFIQVVEGISGPFVDCQVLHTVTSDESAAIFYDGVDSVTLLEHRCALALTFDGSTITRVIALHSQGRLPSKDD